MHENILSWGLIFFKIYLKIFKCSCLACFNCSCNFFIHQYYLNHVHVLWNIQSNFWLLRPLVKRWWKTCQIHEEKRKKNLTFFSPALLNLSTSWDTTCSIIKEFCDITMWNYENVWGESITKWWQLIPNFIIHYNSCLSEQLEISWFLWLVYSYVVKFLETCVLCKIC